MMGLFFLIDDSQSPLSNDMVNVRESSIYVEGATQCYT